MPGPAQLGGGGVPEECAEGVGDGVAGYVAEVGDYHEEVL